jgi:hypothetical protein
MVHKGGIGPGPSSAPLASKSAHQIAPRVSTACQTDLTTAHRSQGFGQHMRAASAGLRAPSGLPSILWACATLTPAAPKSLSHF